MELKIKPGGSITKPFFNSCPSSEYSSETYITYNAEHYERIRNILPIVYSRNYDPKGGDTDSTVRGQFGTDISLRTIRYVDSSVRGQFGRWTVRYVDICYVDMDWI